MTKKTSKGNKSTYALVGLLLLFLAIGLILLALINGKTQYFDNDNKEAKIDSVTCMMSDFKYPIFENKDKDVSATKAVVNLLFENDNIETIDFIYTITYNSNTEARDTGAALKIKFNSAALDVGSEVAEALNSKFSAYNNQMIMNLYAEKDSINAKTAPFLMINSASDGQISLKGRDEYVKNYQNLGFSCKNN